MVHSKGAYQEGPIGGRISAAFEQLSSFLTKGLVQLLVVLLTLLLLGFGVYGLINLRMEFRPEWLGDPEAESMN